MELEVSDEGEDHGLIPDGEKFRKKGSQSRCTGRKILIIILVSLITACFVAINVLFFGDYNFHRLVDGESPECEAQISQSTEAPQKGGSKEDPRVLCMILTTPSNWETKAAAVQNTWARRCFIRIFFYSADPDNRIPAAVALPVPEGREHLTAKVYAALKYSQENYSDDRIDWYLKADDDTYIIWENLQRQISMFNSSDAKYIGKNLRTHLPHGYNSGGAGYVLSKKAVSYLLDAPPSKCRKDGGIEDVDIGECLAKFGVYPENTLDKDGLLKFNSDNPIKVMKGDDQGLSDAYYITKGKMSFGNPGATDRMLSPDTISLHYVEPEEMIMFDFLIYDLKKGSQ